MQKIEENAKTQKSPIMPNIAKNAKFHHKLQNCPKCPNRKITKNSKYHQKCKKSQQMTKITVNDQNRPKCQKLPKITKITKNNKNN